MSSAPTMNQAITPPAAEAVLRLWFGEGARDAVRDEWFRSGDAFDAEIEQRFAAEIEAALRGRLDHWQATPDGAVALILLLDQFTRNTLRHTPRAFAGDARALAVARRAVDAGLHQSLPLLRRWFLFMPYEHAEDLAVQEESVRLFVALAAEAQGGPHAEAIAGALDYARRHEAVIRRFGRFPHRNEVLGRVSTAEEVEFLRQPGSRF
jgi:uncharacterized protein (DUF924 family)